MNRISSLLLRLLFRFRYSRSILWAVSLCSVSLVLFFAVRSTNLISVPVGWEQNFNLTPAGYGVRDFSLCTNGSFVAAVVESDLRNERGVFCCVSVDGGVTFTGLAKVAALPSAKAEVRARSNPQAAFSADGVLSVVWQEYDETAALYSISISSSSDYGSTWSVPVRLNFGTGMDFMPRIYYDDRKRLHLYYLSSEGAGFNLFHCESRDGATFQEPDRVARLAGSMKGSFFPSIVYAGNKVYAAWQSRGLERDKLTDDIYFSTSSNYGSSWSSPDKISTGFASNSAPCLVMSKGRLICVYENNERKNWEIRFQMSLNGGDTWDSAPMTVSSTNANCYSPCAVVSDSDEVVFFWYDNREGANRIFTRRYGLNDNRFSKELSLSDGAEQSRFPAAYLSGRRVAALWEQGGRIRGKFSDINAAPPALRSTTHPEGVWTKNQEAVIEWTPPYDESGVAGYASILSKESDTNPTVQNLNENTRMERIRSLGDGVTWYHIRTIDGAGNYSRPVHYPLRVSRNPLSIPVIESKTHPEGAASPNNSPSFTWQVADIERVKGFLYSLTKDIPAKPVTFTEELGASFEGLDEGRYFFRLQAVDKTNRPGRVADYEFVVGRAENIDPTKYSKIAQGEDIEPEKQEDVVPRAAVVWHPPVCVIDLPGGSVLENKDAVVTIKTQASRSVRFNAFSYELFRDGAKIAAGASGSGRIRLKNLADGTYTLAVRGRYSLPVNGRNVQGETTQARVLFSVRIPPALSPVALFTSEVADQAARYYLPLIIILFSGGSLLTVKGNLRLLFRIKGIVYRISTRLRLLLLPVR